MIDSPTMAVVQQDASFPQWRVLALSLAPLTPLSPSIWWCKDPLLPLLTRNAPTLPKLACFLSPSSPVFSIPASPHLERQLLLTYVLPHSPHSHPWAEATTLSLSNGIPSLFLSGFASLPLLSTTLSAFIFLSAIPPRLQFLSLAVSPSPFITLN